MTPALLQDALVTIVAAGAVSLIVRRVLMIGRQKPQGACGSCPSSRGVCSPAAPALGGSEVKTLTLHLVRKH
jgi:hypothetical protein